MLPRFLSIILVIGIQSIFVVSQGFAPPEIPAANDPDTTFKPLAGRPADEDVDEAFDSPKVIRGLLVIRQDSCASGSAACNDGGCCPTSGTCCGGRKCCAAGKWCYGTGCCRVGENGCEENSCCTSGQTCCKGGGCCSTGWYCDVVNGVKGCCKNGNTCGTDSGDVVCTNEGYIPCATEKFCCPAGYECYRDAAGNARCRTPLTTTQNPSGTSSSSTPTPTSSTPTTPASNISSAVTLKSAFNLFGITLLLGWIVYLL